MILFQKNKKNHLKEIITHSFNEKIITIINENNGICSGKIFGNNDILAANISNLINADLLILYTNVNGIYKNFEKKEIFKLINKNQNISKYISNTNSSLGKGGMLAKINSSKLISGQTIICHNSKNLENIINCEEEMTIID